MYKSAFRVIKSRIANFTHLYFIELQKLNYIRMNNKLILILLTGSLFSSIIFTNCEEEIIPPEYETYTDNRDREIYDYVKIGNQYWMSENLRFKPDSGKYWAYNNNETDIILYGYLYSWETAINVCPTGWHLPSNAEWSELSDFLGGESEAGGKMKIEGTTYWNSPNTDATNSSGFSALGCGTYTGSYLDNDEFDGRRNLTYFWSSEVQLNIWWLSAHYGYLGSSMVNMHHQSASVRCIKD